VLVFSELHQGQERKQGALVSIELSSALSISFDHGSASLQASSKESTLLH
jgi:hypothetical protein